MKKILIIISSLIFLGSCTEQLELSSPSQLTASGYWDSETGARSAHSGLYGNLRSANNTFWALGELRSDIWGGLTFESPSSVNFIESNITAATAPYGGWAGLYSNIHVLNDFILNVPSINFQNENSKKHMMGQAYGLRALYYYTLIKTWGEVPIITEPLFEIDPNTLDMPRSSQTDVMNLIKSDIEASLNSFGNDNSMFNGSNVYWSKAATLALKGDVFLWSGNLLGGGSSDFSIAKSSLNEISNLGFKLEESYNKLWGAGNERNKEFIFAVDFAQDEASNQFNLFTGRSTEINAQYNEKGESMSSFIIAGGNRYGQSEKTILLLEDSKDARGDANFIKLYKDDNAGSGYPNYNADKYFGSIFNKFLGRVSGTVRIFDSNIPYYRYADVLLMLAEAKAQLGEDPSVEINLIRQRAYGSNYDASIHAYSNSTKSQNINAILQERYKEFIGEGKRWWDLRRAGDSYVIQEIEFLNSGDEYKLLLPITVDMIGRNPSLTQTPGY